MNDYIIEHTNERLSDLLWTSECHAHDAGPRVRGSPGGRRGARVAGTAEMPKRPPPAKPLLTQT